MSIIPRPSYLVWHDDAWRAFSRKALIRALLAPQTPRETDLCIEHLRHKLIEYVEAASHVPETLLIPDVWLQSVTCDLGEPLPEALLGIAAQTHAGLALSYSELEQQLAYWQDSDNLLHVSVLANTYYLEIIELGFRSVISFRLARLSILQSRRKKLANSLRFHPYSESYVSQQHWQRQQRSYLYSIASFALLASLLGSVIWQGIPSAPEPFTWPWPAPQTSMINTGFSYLQTLPPTLRLERVEFHSHQVQLAVTGPEKALTLWLNHWPKNLPALEVVLNDEVMP